MREPLSLLHAEHCSIERCLFPDTLVRLWTFALRIDPASRLQARDLLFSKPWKLDC